MQRDFTLGWDYEFTVDLPDGDYHLTITFGDEIASINTARTVNGEDQGSLQPGGPGKFAEHDVDVVVTDGQLTLAMRDDGRLNGLTISQVVPPSQLDVEEASVEPPQVALSWDAVEGAQSYTLHRSPEGSGNFSEVGTTTEPEFTDDEVETGFSYDYALTQTTKAGAVSGLSDPVRAAVIAPGVEPAAVPQDLALAQADDQATTLGWSGSDDTDQYHVYRSLSENSEWERIGTTADTGFTVEGSSEHSWNYTVSAVNEGGASERSASQGRSRDTHGLPRRRLAARSSQPHH